MHYGILDMHTMKTAISVEDSLMKQADKAAEEAGVSRSRLFSIAMEAYLKKLSDEQMLEQLNRSYADGPTEEERAWTQFAKRKMAKIVEPW
jgi:elongation factor P--beta-lysine ligase